MESLGNGSGKERINGVSYENANRISSVEGDGAIEDE